MRRPEAPPLLPQLAADMPPQGQWTYEDYRRLPDDGVRYEVLRGVLYMSPAPRPRHQIVAGNLFAELRQYVNSRGLGIAFVGPVDVILGDLATPGEPDVLFVSKKNAGIVKDRFLEGALDLVVEVLSPSNPRHDRVRKFGVYAEGGVSEYWIVDLKARTVEVFTLRKGKYALLACAAERDRARSRVVKGFSIPLTEVLQGV